MNIKIANKDSIIYMVAFITVVMTCAMLLSWTPYPAISGCLLMLCGGVQFIYYFKTTRNYLNSRGIFALAWFLSMGLAALRIHPLQTEWKFETWFCLWLVAVLFLLGFEVADRLEITARRYQGIKFDKYIVILVLSAIILLVFAIETVHFGELPMFSESMSAYKDFAMPYLHYITVSCILIPPLSILYIIDERPAMGRRLVLLAISGVMLLIPVLIVSRQLLIMGVIFAFLAFLEKRDLSKIEKKYIIAIVILLIVAWAGLSLLRNQNDAYIKAVFQLDDKLSVPIYRAYMYIAFNFDNFNFNVGELTEHSWGFNSLFPIWTLSASKGLWPEAIKELSTARLLDVYTTYPFVMTAYLDAGILGVGIYSTILGWFVGNVEKRRTLGGETDIISHVMVNYCLVFSFFTAFFSNTSVWVYFLIIYIYKIFTVDKRKENKSCKKKL